MTPNQPRTAAQITERDGRLVVTWPTGRGLTTCTPDVIEGWAAQVNTLRAERDRLRALVAAADEYGDRHVIDLTPSGWTIAHPLSCRAAGLFACPVITAAHDLEEAPAIGKFEATVRDGQLVIGDRIEARP